MIVQDDITALRVDAIVNAANNSLLGGGGVDGAIHRAAGPELLRECQALAGCETGEAKITKDYKLPAKWVIHTVGPVWHGGGQGEADLLARCYQNSLTLAAQYPIHTMAFPAISAGVYGFPMDRAARIAVSEVYSYLQQDTKLSHVFLVCFNDRAVQEYSGARLQHAGHPGTLS